MAKIIPESLSAFHSAKKPLVYEFEANPFVCEFWPVTEIESYNDDYEVEKYAPGFLGFATTGGGEMFAISPAGSVVIIPFIGMSPNHAEEIAATWPEFERVLNNQQ